MVYSASIVKQLIWNEGCNSLYTFSPIHINTLQNGNFICQIIFPTIFYLHLPNENMWAFWASYSEITNVFAKWHVARTENWWQSVKNAINSVTPAHLRKRGMEITMDCWLGSKLEAGGGQARKFPYTLQRSAPTPSTRILVSYSYRRPKQSNY